MKKILYSALGAVAIGAAALSLALAQVIVLPQVTAIQSTDLFQDIAGVPTSSGSKALARRPAPEDSDVVRRWRAAGLLIFGKTNTPEFGARNVTEPALWGPTRNPWDPTRTPGGSSGG